MVTGVVNDSTNLGKKKTRPHRPQSLPPSERSRSLRLLFASERDIYQPYGVDASHIPMPKTLTASLPVFNGKSKKLKYFRTCLETASKCILTSLIYRKSILFTCLLLRGNALQAYCNIDHV